MYNVGILDDRFNDGYEVEKEILKPIAHVCEGHSEFANAYLVNQYIIDKEFIDLHPNLRYISRYGTGVDNIDTYYAKSNNIKVLNVEDYCSEEVAEHTISLITSLNRHITQISTEVKHGYRNIHTHYPIKRLSQLTLGIVGYGHIGYAVKEIAKQFGFKSIFVHDTNCSTDYNYDGVQFTTFDYLIKNSDIITFHIPGYEKNKHLVNKETISTMRDGVILVNTARESIFDIDAVYEGLCSGKLRGVGLDFGSEVSSNHIFNNMHNIIITDHCAYYSEDSVKELRKRTALNLYIALMEDIDVRR